MYKWTCAIQGSPVEGNIWKVVVLWARGEGKVFKRSSSVYPSITEPLPTPNPFDAFILSPCRNWDGRGKPGHFYCCVDQRAGPCQGLLRATSRSLSRAGKARQPSSSDNSSNASLTIVNLIKEYDPHQTKLIIFGICLFVRWKSKPW